MLSSLLALSLCLTAPLLAAQAKRPVSSSAESLHDFLLRIESEAADILPEATEKRLLGISRTVFANYAFPSLPAFISRMDGCGILILFALSKKKEELPLSHAYIESDGKVLELRRVRLRTWSEPPEKSAASRLYGPYRSLEVYLLPMKETDSGGSLFVDFKEGRRGFRAVEDLQRKPAPRAGKKLRYAPSPIVINDYLDFEYPGFADFVGLPK